MDDARLRSLREEQGMSFAQIAELTGESKDALQKRYKRHVGRLASGAASDVPADGPVGGGGRQGRADARGQEAPASGVGDVQLSFATNAAVRLPFVGLTFGYADLETTSLNASFGRLLCGSDADVFGKVTTLRSDDRKYRGRRRTDDGPLAAAIRDRWESYDVLVTWNGKRFDVPFLNARLTAARAATGDAQTYRPIRGDLKHIDALYLAKGQNMKLHSARLVAVQEFLGLGVEKNSILMDMWQDALDGDRAAMDYVVEHCERDVLVLREAFAHLKPFVKVVHR